MQKTTRQHVRKTLKALGRALLLGSALLATQAHAGILFTPHMSEYSILPRGQYSDHTVVFTHINEVFNSKGDRVPLAQGLIPPGESVDAALLLFRYLWVGNIFEDTGVPWLSTHNQVFRVIATAGWQQSSGAATERSRLFGLHSNATGLGDVFLLAGIYGNEHRWGPVKANTIWSTTFKLPVGQYDTRSLLNNGTNYSTVIPQVGLHAEAWGRLIFDGTFAWQFNGGNDTPAFAGLTPTQPADLRNIEANLAWKLNEKWFVDLGVFHRESIGPNRYGKVTASFVEPQPPATACASAGIPPAQCGLANFFQLVPVPGERADLGTEVTYLSTSLYYIYRSSSVVDFRVSFPIRGRGAEFTMDYDVALASDPTRTPIPGASQSTTLFGVQEAASTPAVPLFELRFVYLFWAP